MGSRVSSIFRARLNFERDERKVALGERSEALDPTWLAQPGRCDRGYGARTSTRAGQTQASASVALPIPPKILRNYCKTYLHFERIPYLLSVLLPCLPLLQLRPSPTPTTDGRVSLQHHLHVSRPALCRPPGEDGRKCASKLELLSSR